MSAGVLEDRLLDELKHGLRRVGDTRADDLSRTELRRIAGRLTDEVKAYLRSYHPQVKL